MALKTASHRRTTVKDQSGAGKLKIGELLSKAGYITATQFEQAKGDQKKSGRRLSHIMLDNGYIEQDTVVNFLSRMHNYPAVTISKEPPSNEAIQLVPYKVAKKFMAFPLRVAGNTLQITMAEPTNTEEVEELQEIVKKGLNVCVSTAKDIIDAYRDYYKIADEEYKSFFTRDEKEEEEAPVTQVDDFGALVSDAAEDYEIGAGEEKEGPDQFSASDAPIIKLVNGILIKAVQEGVSDIHIEPYEKAMQVRYRKDGSLFKSMNLPLTIKNAL
ncbi:MAG: type IV-A pilus assembly ATPase PilB, partial [Desulfobulbaceae bacterium]|nr:type IV-A pilus assembly ATPase PilB [Desulfobulbaceae bacterium]